MKGEKRPTPVWLGANLGKNKDTTEPHLDYSVPTHFSQGEALLGRAMSQVGVALIGPYANYIVINVSSPNTPGLRALQNKKELKSNL